MGHTVHIVHIVRAFIYLATDFALVMTALTVRGWAVKNGRPVRLGAAVMFFLLALAAVSMVLENGLDSTISIYCLTPVAFVLLVVLWATMYANRTN